MIRETAQLRWQDEEFKGTPYLGADVQTQGNLKSDASKYRAVLENMEEAYFELNLAGSITFFNAATVGMLGYPPEEVMQMNYRQYVLPETAIRLFKIFNTIYRTGKPAEIFDYQIIRKDGTRRFREMSASLIRGPAQEPAGFRCLARDVTKRKLAEEALKKKDAELERKSVSLVETNAALKVLLKQRGEDKVEFERSVVSNVRKIIVPYIEVLKESPLTADQHICVDIIEANLHNIVSPFLRNITLHHSNLTPKEFRVATLIKEGKTTKEIAAFFNVSLAAVNFHRNRIRKKLGVNDRRTNLRSHLLLLS